MKKIFVFLFLVLSLSARSQQTLTTINGLNAYVHLPWDYNNGQNKIYPVILAFPGLDEVGTNASLLLINSPSSWISKGWNGNLFVDGDSIRFIVITIQPSAAYPVESLVNTWLATIKATYRCGDITLTGFSHGGWIGKTFVTGDAYGGPYTYASQIKNVWDVEGVLSDDNSPYPNLFDNFALAANNKFYLGFEQSNDNRGIPTVVSRLNAARSGTARMITTSYGSGQHGFAERIYGGDGSNVNGTNTNQTPASFTIDGISQTGYEWVARHSTSDTSYATPDPPAVRQYILTNKRFL